MYGRELEKMRIKIEERDEEIEIGMMKRIGELEKEIEKESKDEKERDQMFG